MRKETDTQKQLISELETLREENAALKIVEAEHQRQMILQHTLSQIQEEISKMERAEDIARVLVAVRTGMEELEVPFEVCGVNVVDETAGLPSVRFHTMTQEGKWFPSGPNDPGVEVVLLIWRNQKVAYRKDLEAEDPYGETKVLDPYFGYHIRCIVDVPFTYGTLAVNSTKPEAFSERHIAIMQELAKTISLGYTRFLDFQRLEELAKLLDEHNRHLGVERVFERVRAEIASMKESQDLFKVIGVVEESLRDLAVQCDEHTFNIINESAGTIQNYWSRGLVGQGKIDEGGDISALYAHWKKGKTYQRFMREHGRWIVDAPFSHGSLAMNRGGFEPFSQEDILLLERLAGIISLGYDRFLDFQRFDETQRQMIEELEDELQTAHNLQMDLMPREAPHLEGLDLAGRCIPANHVGGDFFQYFPQDDQLLLCLADVTGHAMEAAIPMVMFSGILKTEIKYGPTLERLFASLNYTLCESLITRTFVCFALGELELSTRVLRFSNAGCPYPYHYRAATGQVVEVQLDAYPLGVRPDTLYRTIEVQLEPGDRVVFCSDGIIEAASGAGELFGFERTAEAIRSGCAVGLSASKLLEQLIQETKSFSGEVPQGDDQTVVVLKVDDRRIA